MKTKGLVFVFCLWGHNPKSLIASVKVTKTGNFVTKTLKIDNFLSFLGAKVLIFMGFTYFA